MNPIPVVTDKALLALEPYPMLVTLLASSCGAGEMMQTSSSTDDLPRRCSCCSPPCTLFELLSFATARYPLGTLELQSGQREHFFPFT